MSKALFLAAACALCLGQANATGYAIDVKFAKSDVSYDQFRADRDHCLSAASKTHYTDGFRSVPYREAYRNFATYNLNRFYGCMVSRGYQPNNNGWRAARFQPVSQGEYALVRL